MDNAVVVLCIIVGAGLSVLLAYSATHMFFRQGPEIDDIALKKRRAQIQYMREVRMRNHKFIAATCGDTPITVRAFLSGPVDA
ncbi:uncharacterized protein K489DRAFT_377866 [Dissoconium aciculare CBS 342.82]|uniref:Uncharacterized protein n=1 Tax=Dissoconium aciculare CBS 342.82 TaxID=1314786 RepID=A0A6J3MBB6_9PEZI|nr:uncharacterized protein K489DRAFT_377866 [Dissoconium aciculare CBS 342.82]KAF1825316.1 hypothetical protein K489DRAFT_377866 [Dissoconium aciculare CBS 342.82]